MSSSNHRFGRRAARQNDDLRAEPVLSFNPKKGAAARDPGSEPEPSLGRPQSPKTARNPQAAPRVEREDAEEFGVHFGHDSDAMPRFLRDDDGLDSKHGRSEKAFDPRPASGERPLYHHLFDESENRRRGVGWVAALASVAVVAIGAAYAWHNFMARPAPANLFEPPGVAMRGNSGYTTPQQPAAPDADVPPAPLAATPPAAASAPPTQDIATRPQPKSIPAEPPPPPRKTISEAAANPGSLGAPTDSATPPAPQKPAVAKPMPDLKPPPKQETAKHETAKPEAAKQETPKPQTAKRATPPKEASIASPKPPPAPAPRKAAPRQSTESHAAPQTAAAPALTPPRARAPQATAQPQSLSREAPAAYPPRPQQLAPQPPSVATRSPPRAYAGPNAAAPADAAPAPNGPNTVTVDGVTYVDGEQPHALGTLNGSPDGGNVAMPASAAPTPLQPAPPASPAYSPRPYTPVDRDGGAPLPNDVIILPNGQLAVPNGR